jgi:hypothetical protein
MTGTMVQLPRALEMLIESRLDTIDRMLVGRMPRPDRLAIVREVESQIYDLLQEGEHDEHTRESILGVLARLDPPEAYLPEETSGEPTRAALPLTRRSRIASEPHGTNAQVGRTSGILGLVAAFMLLLSPLPYVLGLLLESEIVMLCGWGAEILTVFALSILGIVLGTYARCKGAWAIVGVVASALSILAVLVGSATLVALILAN